MERIVQAMVVSIDNADVKQRFTAQAADGQE